MSWGSLIARLVLACLRHPPLAIDLLRVAWRFRARGWYARFPFLPLPSVPYVRWRMMTAYGDPDIVPPADDIIRYARWIGKQP